MHTGPSRRSRILLINFIIGIKTDSDIAFPSPRDFINSGNQYFGTVTSNANAGAITLTTTDENDPANRSNLLDILGKFGTLSYFENNEL